MQQNTVANIVIFAGNWEYTTNTWQSGNRWEDFFVPPSPKCQWIPVKNDLIVWRNSSHDVHNTVLYPLDTYALQYYKPFRVEQAFAEKIRVFHGRPWIWWIGQLLAALFHVQSDYEEFFRKRAKAIGFRSPIVGIHVRRSDKVVSEARPYDLERYMEFVDEYYERLEMVQKVDQRRVFLASDAPSVYTEFRMK